MALRVTVSHGCSVLRLQCITAAAFPLCNYVIYFVCAVITCCYHPVFLSGGSPASCSAQYPNYLCKLLWINSLLLPLNHYLLPTRCLISLPRETEIYNLLDCSSKPNNYDQLYLLIFSAHPLENPCLHDKQAIRYNI